MLRAAAAALVLPVLAGVASAQSAPIKLALVNTQELMAAAPGRAAAEATLNKEGDAYRVQIQKMQDSINAMLAKYQKDEPTLTAPVKDTRQKAIQSLETELQAQSLKFQQQFAARQTEVMAPITDAVKKVLDDIRVEGGYTAILANDAQSSSIVSYDKNIDITDRVVSRLRATAPAAAKTADSTKKPGAPAAPAGVTRPPKPPTQ
jgi:outer membrane protein